MSQKFVNIKNGKLDTATINGVYEFISFRNNGKLEVQVRMADGTTPFITIPAGYGKVEQVNVGQGVDAQLEQGLTGKMTEEQVEAIIVERFQVMDNLTRTLVSSKRMNSLIITGAAGIGKTYNIEQYLEEQEALGQHWGSIGGKCTAFGLYTALFEYRNEGSVLVMDDVDVFGDEDQLNLLKKALDTTKRRVLDWRSASKNLDELGIPDSFEFKGKIIFLTNTDMHSEIRKQTKRAPHMNALISRSVTLDLGIHCVKTILLHVRHVVRKTNMLVEEGLTPYQQEQVISYLERKRDDLIALSLRTPLMISELVKANPKGWETDCDHTFLETFELTY